MKEMNPFFCILTYSLFFVHPHTINLQVFSSQNLGCNSIYMVFFFYTSIRNVVMSQRGAWYRWGAGGRGVGRAITSRRCVIV